MPETWRKGAPSADATDSTWWTGYRDRALVGRLTERARQVVEADSRLLADTFIVPPGTPNAWNDYRVRTGLVVGAVQSGKTASMLAVASLLLDRKTDILVFLGGTRVALWRQTFERLLEQLDGYSPGNRRKRSKARLVIPSPRVLADDSMPSSWDYLRREETAIRRALDARRPVIVVLLKETSHLVGASRFLEQLLGSLNDDLQRPLHMVLFDDEADDGSILDAGQSKSIPRCIEMLWTGTRGPATMHPMLHATYVAYTATPAANQLQVDHNPLAPRDFCAALRAPYKMGEVEPRTPTFREPSGVKAFYCGGEFYYKELKSPNRLVSTEPFPSAAPAVLRPGLVRAAADRLLVRAFRAFLVAGGIRLWAWEQQTGLSLDGAYAGVGKDELPPPHTMLIHPSAQVTDHFAEARRLVMLTQGLNPDVAAGPEDLRFDHQAILADLAADPSSWSWWMEEYESSKKDLAHIYGAADLPQPPQGQWPAVADAISRLVPFVRLRVINSDPDADDRPQFKAVVRNDSTFGPAPDTFTVFVSGNVLARGITVEGLCTSVFTRSVDVPAEDAQQQMQRWFGYRGAHAHLCRLFCFDDQATLFREYHERDTSTREEILAGMDDGTAAVPALVLTGLRSVATAKVPINRMPLHPGATPSVRLLETGVPGNQNSESLAELLEEGEWEEVVVGHPRGRIRKQTATLAEVADLLDRFRYTAHDPSPDFNIAYSRWAELNQRLRHGPAFYRPPGNAAGPPADTVKHCPYSTAAYLRLWDEALRRPRCDGLFASDQPQLPWSAAVATLSPPRFYIGVRYGDEGVPSHPLLAKHGVQAMRRSLRDDWVSPTLGVLKTLWGTRGRHAARGYLGDQLFDYHFHGRQPPAHVAEGPVWRPRGHPGLVLFHVVKSAGNEGVTVGLALPAGGPDHIAAVRRT